MRILKLLDSLGEVLYLLLSIPVLEKELLDLRNRVHDSGVIAIELLADIAEGFVKQLPT